jgi:ParB family chromosome partitioning protein
MWIENGGTAEGAASSEGASASDRKSSPKGLKGKGATLLILDPADVEFEADFNPRSQDLGDIKELARGLWESAQAGRDISPIHVRREGSKYIVVDGHRRVLAAREAKIDLPALRVKPTDESDTLIRALIGNQGKPLMPVEEALAFKKLVDEHKVKPKDIARATGKSLANVKERLQLAEGDREVLEAVSKREISASLGAGIAHKSKGNKKKQKKLVQRAKSSKSEKRRVHVEVGLNAPDNKRKLAVSKYTKLFEKEAKAYNLKASGVKVTTKAMNYLKKMKKTRNSVARLGYLAGVLAGCLGKV